MKLELRNDGKQLIIKFKVWLLDSGAGSGSTIPVLTSVTPEPYTSTRRPAATSPRPIQPCKGECVSGLFALFCDDVDTEAHCPDEGSCCITAPTPAPTTRFPALTKPVTHTTTTVTTTTRWVQWLCVGSTYWEKVVGLLIHIWEIFG